MAHTPAVSLSAFVYRLPLPSGFISTTPQSPQSNSSDNDELWHRYEPPCGPGTGRGIEQASPAADADPVSAMLATVIRYAIRAWRCQQDSIPCTTGEGEPTHRCAADGAGRAERACYA